MKIYQFEAGNSCYWVKSMKKEYIYFPLSLDIILKQNYKACQWDLCDRACTGRHADKSLCLRNWSCRQHNKFYQKSYRQKFFKSFFSRLKRDLFFNFCVRHKIWYIRKASRSWKNALVCFHSRHNQENKLLLTYAFFLQSVLS